MLAWIIEILRSRQKSSPVYYVLLGVLLLKFSVLAVICFYWWEYFTKGKRYDLINTFQGFLFSVAQLALFSCLYLIGNGWRILTSGVPRPEIRSTALALIILFCSLLFFSFYNPDYYWLSIILLYFFVIPKIFTSVSNNLRLLDTQLSLYHSNQIIPSDNYLSEISLKRTLYVGLRNCLLGYLVAILIVNSLLKILLSWEVQWITQLCNELAVLLLVIFVLWNLRPSCGVVFTTLRDLRVFTSVLDEYNFNQRSREDRMNEMNEMEINYNPWDLEKTVVFIFPQRIRKIVKVGIISRIALSVGYEESYDRDQLKD